jgi:hypothetical protein
MGGIDKYNNITSTNEFHIGPSMVHIILLAAAMFSLSFITVLGNTIVIYALRTNRHLRTVMLQIFCLESIEWKRNMYPISFISVEQVKIDLIKV